MSAKVHRRTAEDYARIAARYGMNAQRVAHPALADLLKSKAMYFAAMSLEALAFRALTKQHLRNDPRLS